MFLNAAARRLRRGSQVSVRRPDGTFGVTSFTDRGGTFDLFMQLRVHVGDQAAPTDLILGAQPRVTLSLHSASANRRTQQEENRNMIAVDA